MFCFPTEICVYFFLGAYFEIDYGPKTVTGSEITAAVKPVLRSICMRYTIV